jgi:hypothetical protein
VVIIVVLGAVLALIAGVATNYDGRTVRMKVTRYCAGYCAIFNAIIWELPGDRSQF